MAPGPAIPEPAWTLLGHLGTHVSRHLPALSLLCRWGERAARAGRPGRRCQGACWRCQGAHVGALYPHQAWGERRLP
jgi:hypothetical protein